MPNTVHALDFLAATEDRPLVGICVAFGDEPFLKTQVWQRVRQRFFVGEEEAPFATLDGTTAEWRDVHDELSTIALFGSAKGRLVMVTDADDFVSRYRTQLEAHADAPGKSGLLALDVHKWTSNTRLFKAIDKNGLQIECKPPTGPGKSKAIDQTRICRWLVSWCQTKHEAVLDNMAAQAMLELVGPEFGLLEQELAKLALFAGREGTITLDMVHDVVGGWRTKTTWELLEAAADGDADEAILQLDRLLQAGEHPQALFGQISWSLRRFAAATRTIEHARRHQQRVTFAAALTQAGFRKWPADALSIAERQLRQLGRHRAGDLYRLLLETDLALKGSHSTPRRARLALESLFFSMSKQLDRQSPTK